MAKCVELKKEKESTRKLERFEREEKAICRIHDAFDS